LFLRSAWFQTSFDEFCTLGGEMIGSPKTLKLERIFDRPKLGNKAANRDETALHQGFPKGIRQLIGIKPNLLHLGPLQDVIQNSKEPALNAGEPTCHCFGLFKQKVGKKEPSFLFGHKSVIALTLVVGKVIEVGKVGDEIAV